MNLSRIFLRAFAICAGVLVCGFVLIGWVSEAPVRRELALSGVLGLLVMASGGLWLWHRIQDQIADSRRSIRETIEVDVGLPVGTLSDDLVESGELRRMVDLLEADKARLSVLLGAMSEAVVMLDGLERVLAANPVAEKVLGLRSGYEGQRLSEMTPMSRLVDIVSEVLWKQMPMITEVDWRVESNDTRHYWVSVAPILSDDKEPAGVVAVLYDVTRLRRLERVRRDFVANVSHELRTPIATIQSSAETLLMDGMDLGPIGSEFAETIYRQAGRMAQIVEDLLTLSRIEATGEGFSMQHVNLSEITDEIEDRFFPVAEHRGVSLVVDLPEDLGLVEAEPRALKQILSVLVENGLKYTPGGGRVTIRASVMDGGVMVAVEDTGIGISPEHIHRVFERFYRVDTGRSRDVGGTGLGLAIAKHLVRRLGGDLVLESQPQRGSVFKFWLRAVQ